MPGILNNPNPMDIIAQNAEKLKSGCVAIAVSSWHLPVYKQTLVYTVSSLRKATVIEEYIMKAAGMELSYDLEISDLTELLGLDEIFLNTAIDSLADKNIIDKTILPLLRLTDIGKSFLATGTVPNEEKNEQIEYYIDRKTANVYAMPKEAPQIGIHPKFEYLDKKTENIKKYINHKFLTTAGKILGKELENPQKGTKITAIVSAKTTDAVKTLFTEIILYNISENKLIRMIWDHAGHCFNNEWAKILDLHGADSGFKVDIKKADAISAQIQNLVNSGDTTFRICRGSDKAAEVEKIINTAKSQILISLPSPDCEEIKKFSELLKSGLQSGVRVCLIYNNPADADAADALNNLLQEGNNNLCIVQSDKCDITEIISDNAIIVSDISWANCSGDFSLCDDAVYITENEDFVEKQKKHLENIINN